VFLYYNGHSKFRVARIVINRLSYSHDGQKKVPGGAENHPKKCVTILTARHLSSLNCQRTISATCSPSNLQLRIRSAALKLWINSWIRVDSYFFCGECFTVTYLPDHLLLSSSRVEFRSVVGTDIIIYSYYYLQSNVCCCRRDDDGQRVRNSRCNFPMAGVPLRSCAITVNHGEVSVLGINNISVRTPTDSCPCRLSGIETTANEKICAETFQQS